MITPIISWLHHVWAALAAVTARDWLYYVIALPIVGVVAWFAVPGKVEDDESLR